MLNCRQAAELISRTLDEKLTLRQRIGLRLHLLHCALCRHYREQLGFLRATTRRWASGNEFVGDGLSSQAKQWIGEALKKRLDKEGGRDDYAICSEEVLGVEIDGRFKAYPFSELARTSGEIVDEINGKKIVIRFDKQHRLAQLYDGENKLLPSITGFWFAWMAFHPDSDVFSAD